jgi:hypothetical protein
MRKRQRRVGTFFRSGSRYGSSRGKRGREKEVEHNDVRGSLKTKENTTVTARADATQSESTRSVSKAGKSRGTTGSPSPTKAMLYRER